MEKQLNQIVKNILNNELTQYVSIHCEGRTVLADPEMIFSLPFVFSSAFKLNVFFVSSSTILWLSDFPNCHRGAAQRIFI